MSRSRELHVIETEDLFGDGPGKLRTAVAVEVHPPGGDHVEILAPLGVMQEGAGCPGEGKQGASQAMLGEGVPDRYCVAFRDGGVGVHP